LHTLSLIFLFFNLVKSLIELILVTNLSKENCLKFLLAPSKSDMIKFIYKGLHINSCKWYKRADAYLRANNVSLLFSISEKTAEDSSQVLISMIRKFYFPQLIQTKKMRHIKQISSSQNCFFACLCTPHPMAKRMKF